MFGAHLCSQELNTTEMLRGLLRKGCQFKHEEACKHLEVAACLLLPAPLLPPLSRANIRIL